MRINQKDYREKIRSTETWYKQQREAEDFWKRSRPKFQLTPWMLEGMRKNQRHLR